ncbi:13445_t:CDS:2, partial [Gigaspora margarita]
MLSEFESSMSMAGKTPHAIYCLCGITKEDKYGVLLVPKEELEEAKQKYKTLTSIHIYSVEECRPKDAFALVITDCKPKKVVSTKPSNIVIKDCKSKNVVSTEPSNIVIKDCKSKNVVSTEQSNIVIKDFKSKNVVSTEPSNIVIKSENVVSTEPSNPSNIVITDCKSKNVVSTEPSNIVITDCKSENVVSTKPSNMVITDCKSKNIVSTEPSNMLKGIKLFESSSAMEIDQEQSQSLSKKQTRHRGRRRVTKKRIYQDAKGFKVSEDTYEWESFSEDECDPRQTGIDVTIKPESSGIKNGINKRGKRKGNDSSQKSLLNFFGKI